MKTQQSEQQVDLNKVFYRIFQNRGYNVETLRKGLLEFYKGWVCSEIVEEVSASYRKELSFQFEIIDEILKALEPAEPFLLNRNEAA